MVQITKQQLDLWEAQSYLVIRGLFSDIAADLSRWVDDVAAWPKDDSKWLTNYEESNPSQLARRENFTPYHEGLAGVINGPIVLRIIEQLMGEPAVLYKDRINFKLPGGGAHMAHQDGVAYEQGLEARFFDPEVKPYVSILIGVDRATLENGCLQVTPNWPINRIDILPMEATILGRPDITKIRQDVEDSLFWIPIPTEPGDTLFFTERLPHRSDINKSNVPRRILYGVYNPASAGDKRKAYFDIKRKNPNDPRYMVGNPHALVKP